MRLDVVPLLETQRELYRLPRGPGRFREYLRVVLTDDRDDVRLPPLVALNPMARDHVPRLLDDLIALGAEAVAAGAAAEAERNLADLDGGYRLGLVVADDAGGGWTDRTAAEFALMAAPADPRRRPWLGVVLWSSEPASARAVREAVLTTAHRTAYARRHGPPRALADYLAQEGHARAAAGCAGPALDPDDLDYTAYVLEPFLTTPCPRTILECLFGDEACRPLGLTPRGLSPRAGLALARARAGLTADAPVR